eukprot:7325740-Prymnesium_polylepis.1
MVGGLGQRLWPRGDALSLSQDDPSARNIFCRARGARLQPIARATRLAMAQGDSWEGFGS